MTKPPIYFLRGAGWKDNLITLIATTGRAERTGVLRAPHIGFRTFRPLRKATPKTQPP